MDEYLVSATTHLITRDGLDCRLWVGHGPGHQPCTVIAPALLCDPQVSAAIQQRGWSVLEAVLLTPSPTVMQQHGVPWEVWRAELGETCFGRLLVDAVILGEPSLPAGRQLN
jgi:hypothetical protein